LRVKIIFILCFLIFLPEAFVFASENPNRIKIASIDDSIKVFRYQIGTEPGSSWTEIDISNPFIVLDSFDSTKDSLFVEQSADTINWSDSYEYQYDSSKESWNVIIKPQIKSNAVSVDSIDCVFSGLYPYGRSSHFYKYTLGIGSQLNLSLNRKKNITAFGAIAYSKGTPNTDWVDRFEIVEMSIGLGYRIPLFEKVQVIPQIGYGVVINLFDVDWDEDGGYTHETFIDQQVQISLNMSFKVSDNYEFFISPISVCFFEEGTVGFMTGCQAGIRMGL
jgi:hypothetical protein